MNADLLSILIGLTIYAQPGWQVVPGRVPTPPPGMVPLPEMSAGGLETPAPPIAVPLPNQEPVSERPLLDVPSFEGGIRLRWSVPIGPLVNMCLVKRVRVTEDYEEVFTFKLRKPWDLQPDIGVAVEGKICFYFQDGGAMPGDRYCVAVVNPQGVQSHWSNSVGK